MKWIRISSPILIECRVLVSSSWVPVWRWPNLIRQHTDRFLVGLLLASFTMSTEALIAIEVAIPWKDQTQLHKHTQKKDTERENEFLSASNLTNFPTNNRGEVGTKRGGIIKCLFPARQVNSSSLWKSKNNIGRLEESTACPGRHKWMRLHPVPPPPLSN
jgi:hypothetical protein